MKFRKSKTVSILELMSQQSLMMTIWSKNLLHIDTPDCPFSRFSNLAHACSCVLTYSFLSPCKEACGGSSWGILALNLLNSAFLTCLLMFPHACSLTIFCHHKGSHNVRGSKWGILILNLLKSTVLACLLMFAHACSCLLTRSFLSPYMVS